MARVSKTERILNLISFLLKSPVPVPWAQIKGNVVGYDDPADAPALDRRFERDKEFLRTLGIPLEYIPVDRFGNTGYFIEKNDYYLPRIHVTPEDVAAVDLVSRMSHCDMGPLRDALQSALRKMQIDFPVPFEIGAEAEERGIRRDPRDQGEQTRSENLDILLRAILNAKRVRFLYHTMGRDAMSERQVEPYGMGFTRGTWYLAGQCLARKDIRVFKVTRIVGDVRIEDENHEGPDFETPEDFDLGDHIGKPVWRLDTDTPVEVKIRFDSTIAWMAARAIGAAGSFKPSADGSGTVSMRVTAVAPFVRWVLSFAEHAAVLSPAWLKKRVCQTARDVANLYKR